MNTIRTPLRTRLRSASRTAPAAVLLSAAALALFPAPAAAQDRAAPMDKSFEVLTQKSIFSRDRARASGAGANAQTRPVRVLSPEQSVAFRGVLCPDEEYVAFIENVQTGQISVVKAGDELARGRVAAITLDTLAYDADGKVLKIQLGQDLTGEIAAPTGGSYSTGGTGSTGGSTAGAAGGSTAGGAATATPAPPVGDASQQAVIERMRQKRLLEEGRK